MAGWNGFLLIATITFLLQAHAATISIDPGAGFADATPSNTIPDQQGNNPGTTLGEMRLILFQEAASVWAGILNSTVPITIAAEFRTDLGCFGTSAVLGFAGATSIASNFGSGDPNVTYPIALAESLAGSDLNAGNAEVFAGFNARVDSDPSCFGASFYYGLDDNAPAGTTALFPVVLHELAHGFGFLSYVQADGSWAGGDIDVYSRLLADLETGKSWAAMTNLELQDSQLNEPDLVWTGPQVTADRALYLGPEPELAINAPAPAGAFEANLGQQSTAIPGGGISAAVIDGNTFTDAFGAPATGCTQIGFSGDGLFAGKIVLFDKSGDCSAVVQAFWGQFQDAVAVSIADTTGVALPDLSGGISNPITIPYIGIHQSEATQLRSNMGVANATIQNSTTRLTGENQGQVKLYAPPVLESGSSISHWSRSATPDLLMEPVLGTLGFKNVDLTAAAFKDIGWSVNIPGGVLDIIFRDGFE